MQTNRTSGISPEVRAQILAAIKQGGGASEVNVDKVAADLGLERDVVEVVVSSAKQLDATPSKDKAIGWNPAHGGGRLQLPDKVWRLLNETKEKLGFDPSNPTTVTLDSNVNAYSYTTKAVAQKQALDAAVSRAAETTGFDTSNLQVAVGDGDFILSIDEKSGMTVSQQFLDLMWDTESNGWVTADTDGRTIDVGREMVDSVLRHEFARMRDAGKSFPELFQDTVKRLGFDKLMDITIDPSAGNAYLTHPVSEPRLTAFQPLVDSIAERFAIASKLEALGDKSYVRHFFDYDQSLEALYSAWKAKQE